MSSDAHGATRVLHLVAATVVAVLCVVLPSPPAHGAPAASVRVTVDSVTPSTPPRSVTKQPLQFVLTLTNLTGTALRNLVVTAERGQPVTTLSALGTLRLAPAPTGLGTGYAIAPTRAVKVTLQPAQSLQVTFSTTTSILDNGGLCQCANTVDPVFFYASSTSGGQARALGAGGTYVPVADEPVNRVRTAWVWPLIDRPHRLLQDAVFSDDDLAAEVAPGGRLDRALQVVQDVAPSVALTLVVDPELIDELAVMASGSYRVQSPDGSSGTSSGTATTEGTGSSAAASWLRRLHAVLTGTGRIELYVLPFGDPDVQSLVAHGRGWRQTMPSAMAARVAHALEGRDAHTDLAWPVDGRAGSATVRTLRERGDRLQLLNASALSIDVADSAAAPGSVAITTESGAVRGLVTTSDLSSLVTSGVETAGDGSLVIPRMLAELAVRVTENPIATASAVLVAPRYVDPDVAEASEVITATAASTYTEPVPVSAVASTPSAPAASARKSGGGTAGLPDVTFDALHALSRSAGTITSLLTGGGLADNASATRRSGYAAAKAMLAALPAAVQRSESAAWRSTSGLDVATGADYADRLSALVDSLRNGVHIVPPSSGSYTLASGNSSVPVTVTNTLDYPVTVDVQLTAVGGLTGLNSRTLENKQIDARSTLILHVPASVERSGRIKVDTYLTAPNGAVLGAPVALTLRGTALGRLGIVIMSVAGGLLVLALARRWYRSMTARRRRPVRARAS